MNEFKGRSNFKIRFLDTEISIVFIDIGSTLQTITLLNIFHSKHPVLCSLEAYFLVLVFRSGDLNSTKMVCINQRWNNEE